MLSLIWSNGRRRVDACRFGSFVNFPMDAVFNMRDGHVRRLQHSVSASTCPSEPLSGSKVTVFDRARWLIISKYNFRETNSVCLVVECILWFVLSKRRWWRVRGGKEGQQRGQSAGPSALHFKKFYRPMPNFLPTAK